MEKKDPKGYDVLKLVNYKVNFDAMPIEGATKELEDTLHQYFMDVQKNKKGVIEKLLHFIEKYPHIPQFKNYLYLAYMKNNREEEALNLLYKTREQHPD